MKKLNLKEFAVTAQEMLTREQLKTIVGGYGGYGSCKGNCSQYMSTPNGNKLVYGHCTGSLCTCDLYGTIHSNTCGIN